MQFASSEGHEDRIVDAEVEGLTENMQDLKGQFCSCCSVNTKTKSNKFIPIESLIEKPRCLCVVDRFLSKIRLFQQVTTCGLCQTKVPMATTVRQSQRLVRPWRLPCAWRLTVLTST